MIKPFEDIYPIPELILSARCLNYWMNLTAGAECITVGIVPHWYLMYTAVLASNFPEMPTNRSWELVIILSSPMNGYCNLRTWNQETLSICPDML
jgi:hypothetical protein